MWSESCELYVGSMGFSCRSNGMGMVRTCSDTCMLSVRQRCFLWSTCAETCVALLCPVLVSGSEQVYESSGDGVPAPQKVLFPMERLSLQWERVYRVGAGLHNLGNTCFLNATVQCLTYTPPLANYLLSREHARNCEWLQQGGLWVPGTLWPPS